MTAWRSCSFWGCRGRRYSVGEAQGGHEHVLLNCLTTEEEWRGLVQAFHRRGGLHAYYRLWQTARQWRNSRRGFIHADLDFRHSRAVEEKFGSWEKAEQEHWLFSYILFSKFSLTATAVCRCIFQVQSLWGIFKIPTFRRNYTMKTVC